VALRPNTAIVKPTVPVVVDLTTTAAPAPTRTSDAAPKTTAVTTSVARSTTAAPVQDTEPDDPPAFAGDPATKPSQDAAPAQNTEPNEPPASAGDPTTIASQDAAGNAHNQWPLPPAKTEVPTTTDALSMLLSAMTSKAEAQASAMADTSGSKDPGETGQQEGSHEGNSQQSGHDSSGSGDSAHLNDHGDPDDGQQHEGSQSSASSNDLSGSEISGGTGREGGSQQVEPQSSGHGSSDGGTSSGDDSLNDPSNPNGPDGPSDSSNPGVSAEDGQAAVIWTHDGKAFTAVSSNGAIVVKGNDVESTLAAGATGTFASQKIEVPAATNAVVVNGAVASFEPKAGAKGTPGYNDPPAATFDEAGDTFTVVAQGESFQLRAGSSTITMAYGAEATFLGQLVSMPASLGINVIEVNGRPFTLRSGGGEGSNRAAASQTQLAAVVTQDGKTYTAILQGASTVVLEAASTTLSVSRGAAVTLEDNVFIIPTSGSVLVHDGTTVSLTPTTLPAKPSDLVAVLTYDGQTLSAADLGSSIVVVAEGSTITLADGAQTTIGQETTSAASTGGAVVVNRTSTLTLSTHTNAADSPSSRDGGAKTTAERITGVESAASRNGLLAWRLTFSAMVGSCVLSFGIEWL
jgi:hypothetical protein